MKYNEWHWVLLVALLMAAFSGISLRFSLPEMAYGMVEQHELQRGTSMMFIGDIMLARHVAWLRAQHGESYPWDAIELERPGVIVIGNFEASMPEIVPPAPLNTMVFGVASSAIPAMRAAGVDAVSLANNHANDFGTDALEHTKTLLSEQVVPFGDPNQLSESTVELFVVNGQRVAVAGLHLLQHTPSMEELELLFQYMDSVSEYQIAYVHWGNEYEIIRSTTQRQQAELLVSAGFDAIIGHHPHVIQNIERINNVLVIYSLGNFVFDQYFSPDVMNGLTVQLDFSNDKIEFLLQPVEMTTMPAQPRLLDDSLRHQALTQIAARSSGALAEEITAGVLTQRLQPN